MVENFWWKIVLVEKYFSRVLCTRIVLCQKYLLKWSDFFETKLCSGFFFRSKNWFRGEIVWQKILKKFLYRIFLGVNTFVEIFFGRQIFFSKFFFVPINFVCNTFWLIFLSSQKFFWVILYQFFYSKKYIFETFSVETFFGRINAGPTTIWLKNVLVHCFLVKFFFCRKFMLVERKCSSKIVLSKIILSPFFSKIVFWSRSIFSPKFLFKIYLINFLKIDTFLGEKCSGSNFLVDKFFFHNFIWSKNFVAQTNFWSKIVLVENYFRSCYF